MNFNERDGKALLLSALYAACKAGQAILEVYNLGSGLAVERKGDNSPLTVADRRSHDVISSCLMTHSFPILSEEGKDIPYSDRGNWGCFWLVDPLDGTKEFIKRNGEFTVNIALIEKDRPVLGVIHVPVKGALYYGAKGMGAHKLSSAPLLTSGTVGTTLEYSNASEADSGKVEEAFGEILKTSSHLPFGNSSARPLTVVASRSHMSEETAAYIGKLREEHGNIETVSAGSSLKFCLVAEGRADVYPRFAPTMEWDTAAGQIIVEEVGGVIVRADDGRPMIYNKENLVNPWFVVMGARSSRNRVGIS